MILSKVLAEESIFEMIFRCLSSKFVASAKWLIPKIPFIGVLISWLIFAKNSDFARVASSAFSFAITRFCSSSFCFVISFEVIKTFALQLIIAIAILTIICEPSFLMHVFAKSVTNPSSITFFKAALLGSTSSAIVSFIQLVRKSSSLAYPVISL